MKGGRELESGPNSASRTWGTILFLALIAAGPLCFVFAERVRTVASVESPVFTWQSFRRGDYADQLGRALKEGSPVTAVIRGAYNDARVLAGIYESKKIHVGFAG